MNTFAKQPQTQRKALEKAVKSPLIGKHGKRKSTLIKEEVYREIQARILEKAYKLIDAQIELALNGDNGKPDPRVIEMLLSRAFGKPSQEVAVKSNVEILFDPKTKALSDKLIKDLIENY